MNANLYALLRDHFAEHIGEPCILIPDGPVIHYDRLDAESARIAHVLMDAGCSPGDRVAVQVDKCWEGLALYLACLRAGLVMLPLNTAYQRSELSYFFEDAEPRVIVCAPESAERVMTLRREATILTLQGGGGTLLDRAADRSETFDPVVSKPDDLAALVYTSGTTGRSKGAMLTHRNLATNALALVAAWGFTRGDVLLHALPIYHIHGLFIAAHCALLSGSRMLWLSKFDATEVRALLPRATVMMGVPTFYTRLLADPSFGASDCRSLRVAISGSAPLLPDTFHEFRTRTGCTLLERYGMSETGINTSNPLDGERVAGSVGLPVPGVSVRVVNGDGTRCGAGEVGEIELKGPNVTPGYWRRPDKTREDFSDDGYFRSGDLGELLPNGYLRIMGRAKDMIITGGLNVYPLEIEEKIDALPGVVESAVVGVPDADFGEAVIAVVVANGASELTESRIIGLLKDEIARFKIPKRVHFVSDLPRNSMGKVQKKVLRESFSKPS